MFQESSLLVKSVQVKTYGLKTCVPLVLSESMSWFRVKQNIAALHHLILMVWQASSSITPHTKTFFIFCRPGINNDIIDDRPTM